MKSISPSITALSSLENLYVAENFDSLPEWYQIVDEMRPFGTTSRLLGSVEEPDLFV